MDGSPLADALKGYLPKETPLGEIQEAADNLAGFMKLLLEIDQEQHTTSTAEVV